MLKTATTPPTSAATPKEATLIDAAIPGTTVDVEATPLEVAEAVGSVEEGESLDGIRTLLSTTTHVSIAFDLATLDAQETHPSMT